MKTPLLRAADLLVSPVTACSALVMLAARRAGVQNLPLTRRMLNSIGVFPIRNHYYEPFFTGPLAPLDEPRDLPGIDWNEDAQVDFLREIRTAKEIALLPRELLASSAFGPGDAEMLYHVIRAFKPARIVEIGSGYSTRIAVEAVLANDNPCEHTCIEPYEMPWLEELPVTVIRQKVECVDRNVFDQLESGDILFIDSSHMIRPQGDVLTEYLQILPRLKPGVVVHVHDIFSPRDYPKRWVVDEVRMWNEQYLLEAFLTNNREWQIVAALNFLHHTHTAELCRVCPTLKPSNRPGSFWMRRVEK